MLPNRSGDEDALFGCRGRCLRHGRGGGRGHRGRGRRRAPLEEALPPLLRLLLPSSALLSAVRRPRVGAGAGAADVAGAAGRAAGGEAGPGRPVAVDGLARLQGDGESCIKTAAGLGATATTATTAEVTQRATATAAVVYKCAFHRQHFNFSQGGSQLL